MTAGKINFDSPSNLKFYYFILFVFMVMFINFDGYDFTTKRIILSCFLLNLTSIIFI